MAISLLPEGPPAPAPIKMLGAVVDWTVVGIGAVMVVLVFCNVMFHVFNKDIAWTTEFCEMLMVWVTFLAAASAARRGAHMSITEFLDMLSDRRRLWADGAIQLVVAGVLGLLLWYGVIIVRSSWGNLLTVLDISMAWQYLALPVGSVATLIFVVFDLAQIIGGKSREQRYGV